MSWNTKQIYNKINTADRYAPADFVVTRKSEPYELERTLWVISIR